MTNTPPLSPVEAGRAAILSHSAGQVCASRRDTEARITPPQGMGFDAVWISPVTSQTGGPVRELQDGWHGAVWRSRWGQ
jgi:hypothetical protein